jgi:hypothetical protein
MITSCSKEVTQEELIREAVALKLAQWKTTQLNECKDRAYMQASDYVDSILLVTSLDTKLDTIPKPARPVKPPKPVFKAKPDTVVVDPIYKKE